MTTTDAPVPVERLVREYRATMDRDVLHSWAADAVQALSRLTRERDEARAALRATAEAAATHLRRAMTAEAALRDALPPTSDHAEYEVWLTTDGGEEEMCAGTSGSAVDALREAMHYAAVYGQDGAVRVERIVRVPVSTSEDTTHD